MLANDRLVKGNAYADGAERGGWFIAQFVDPAHGLRCRSGWQQSFGSARADFEMKLVRHSAGQMESRHFPYNRTATTMSMLVGSGRFDLFFCVDAEWEHVTLQRDGDYALWAPGVGHRWLVHEPLSILTVRCPGVDASDQVQTPVDALPAGLAERWLATVTAGSRARRV